MHELEEGVSSRKNNLVVLYSNCVDILFTCSNVNPANIDFSTGQGSNTGCL